MTHSTVRLWDNEFAYLATDQLPDTAIDDNGDQIEIAIEDPAGKNPIRIAILQAQHRAGYLPNLHITIDDQADNPGAFGHRRGGIIREISFHAGTLVLLIAVHSRTPHTAEAIYPPRGYGIGLIGRGNSDHAIIGCWATEQEARDALADLRIVTLGDARPAWDTNR